MVDLIFGMKTLSQFYSVDPKSSSRSKSNAITLTVTLTLSQDRVLRMLYPVSDVDLLDAYHLCGGRVVTFCRSPESDWDNTQYARHNTSTGSISDSKHCYSAPSGFSEDPQTGDDSADIYWSQQQREKEKGLRDRFHTINSIDKGNCGGHDNGITFEDNNHDAGVASTAGITGSEGWCEEVNLAR